MKRIIFGIIFLFGSLICSAQEYVIYNQPLAAYLKAGLWHFINTEGRELFPPKRLSEFGGYGEGLFSGKMEIDGEEKWVYFDMNGKIVLQPDCDFGLDFSEGIALVGKEAPLSKYKFVYAFINKKGEYITPYKFIDAYSFSEGLAWARQKDTLGYIDKTGRYVLMLDSMLGYKFHKGMAVVSNHEYKMGFINRKGKVVIPLKFDEVADFSDGLAFTHNNGYAGYIDMSGNYRIQPKFNDGKSFSEGRAFVGMMRTKEMMLWGIIDTTGALIERLHYDLVRNFSEGLAAVAENRAWGFIDIWGNYILDPVYSSTGSFIYGMAWASVPNQYYGFIDKNGNYMVEITKPEQVWDLRMDERVY